MPGRKKSYVIELTDEERQQLRKLAASPKTAQGLARRARIILTYDSHADWPDERVAAAVGCSPEMVRLCRKRWSRTGSLKDLPRPGRPRVFSP